MIKNIKARIIKMLDPLFHFSHHRGMKVKLIKDGSLSMVVNIASKGLSMLIGVLLFRVLGSSQYGIYSYVLSLVLTLTIPVEFGLPNLIIRETAKALARKEPAKARGVWTWALRVSIIISVVVIIGAVIASFFVKDILGNSDIGTMFWGVALILIWPLVHLSSAALRGLNNIVLGQIPDMIIVNGFYSLLLVIFAYFIPLDLTAAAAMALRLGATFIAVVFGISALLIKTPSDIKAAKSEFQGRYWISSALPLGLTSGLNTIKNRAGILLLAFFVTSSEIGVYQVAVNTAVIAGMVLHVINTVLAPQFASLFAEGKMKRLQHIVTLSARVAFFFNIVITTIFIIFGKQLLALVFGGDAIDAYIPLIIMLAGQLVNSLAGSVAFLLNMTGHEKDVLKAIGISVVINIVTNLIFIPIWGIAGSAFATALSLTFAQVMMWYKVRKNMHINTLAFGKVVIDE